MLSRAALRWNQGEEDRSQDSHVSCSEGPRRTQKGQGGRGALLPPPGRRSGRTKEPFYAPRVRAGEPGVNSDNCCINQSSFRKASCSLLEPS
jgi:hypothetical protein